MSREREKLLHGCPRCNQEMVRQDWDHRWICKRCGCVDRDPPITSALADDEWIDASVQLPEEMADKSPNNGWSESVRPSDDVLVYLINEHRQTVAWYSHAAGYWTTVDERTIYERSEISYWRALPAPPEQI